MLRFAGMFLIKKIVTPFILPPGAFVTLALLAGGWMIARRRRRGGAGLAALGLLMWLAATPFPARPIEAALERGLHQPRRPAGDVIVLLGGGVDAWAMDMTGRGVPSEAMTARIVTAVRLQARLDLPVIVTGGRVFHMPVSEAAVAARLLADLGVPADRILLEERARDTAENARYCAAICRRQGFARPILVTQSLHMKRAVLAFEAAGLPVTPFPVAIRARLDRPGHWTEWLPQGFESLRNALHEALGLVYYRMTL